MPVKFKSKRSPDILMLDSVATRLIKMMGHSGTIPSSLGAADIGAALDSLRAKIAEAQTSENPDSADDDNDRGISIGQRGLPLVEMLEKALQAGDYVIWEKS